MRTPVPWLLPTEPTRTTDLLAAGATKAMIATQVAGGGLVRVRQGVYLARSAWPDDPDGQRLIGECDGAGKYDGRDAAVRERAREQVLRDLGFRIVRWLATEIMTRPDIVVERVSRELQR